MPAENTLPHDIDEVLQRYALPGEPPKLRGKWFALGFSPDLTTGERLNVGVVLRIGKRQYFRMLHDAEPFARLFGERENIAFFLRLLHNHLQTGQNIKTFSPHLIVDSPKFVAGDDVSEIMADLYHDHVTLSRLPAKKHNKAVMNTTKLRKFIRRLVNEQQPDFARYWVNEPVALPGRESPANIDIYVPQTRQVASLVSLAHSPDIAEQRLAWARGELEIAAPDGRGTLFIYNPERDDREEARMTDNLIDKTHYLLHRQNLKCEVGNTPQQLADMIPQLAA